MQAQPRAETAQLRGPWARLLGAVSEQRRFPAQGLLQQCTSLCSTDQPSPRAARQGICSIAGWEAGWSMSRKKTFWVGGNEVEVPGVPCRL